MITIKTLLMVITTCATEINPEFDPNICATRMVECMQRGNDYDHCTDYYEPLAAKDNFGGDPSDADWSY